MNKKLFVSLVRFVAVIASFSYLAYIVVKIFIIAPGAMTMSQDMFWLALAAGLFLLALLVQRKDSRFGQFLDSL